MISKADFEKSGFLAPPAPAGPPRGSRAGPGARPGPPGRGVPGGSPDPPSEGYFRPKNVTFRHYRVSPTVSGILHFERSGPGLGLGEVLHPEEHGLGMNVDRQTAAARSCRMHAWVTRMTSGSRSSVLRRTATMRGPRSGPQLRQRAPTYGVVLSGKATESEGSGRQLAGGAALRLRSLPGQASTSPADLGGRSWL